jgi:hypothetical protein
VKETICRIEAESSTARIECMSLSGGLNKTKQGQGAEQQPINDDRYFGR